MAEGRTPRIRMPRVSLPGRSRGAGGGDKSEAATKSATAKAKPAAKATEPGSKGTAAAASKPTSPAPNLQERMEGLQGWMAEIERKQSRMTYFAAAGILIAIVAAGAALYFGITAKNESSDRATKAQLDALSTKVDSLQAAVAKNTKDTQNALNDTVLRLQQSIADLQKKQAQAAANIATLQSQAAAGAFGKTPGAAVGTTTTPGAKTKTTP